MKKYKIFIDGAEGTTGLKIHERFKTRDDIEILQISPELRKDSNERKRLINESDVTFLCLPDAAAIEAVSLAENGHTKIIDASTAHRTNPEWAYGFPELSESHRANIAKSNRIANPGCHATGFIAIVFPLIESGLLSKNAPTACQSISGYSGAGKSAIAQYQDPERPAELETPRLYALSQKHKHIPEMMAVTGLQIQPIFTPFICDYYSGMTVTVPFRSSDFACKILPQELTEVLRKHYGNSNFIEVMPHTIDGFIPANSLNDTNKLRLYICGNDEQITITAQFDNLGKGASGAAVQCMNIALGLPEQLGLE